MEHFTKSEDEIDIKEIFSVLLRYRRSILFVTLLVTAISAYVAYMKPSIYEAQALLKIKQQDNGYSGDFLMESFDGSNSDVEDELVVFRSRPIAKEALSTLNLGTRYFLHKRFKTYELYKNTPFTVSYSFLAPAVYGHTFTLIPVDDKHFRLKLAEKHSFWHTLKTLFSGSSTSKKTAVSYDKVHQYGEKIETPWFSLTINRLYPMGNDEYAFSIVPNAWMTQFVQGGIGATTLSKYGRIVALTFHDTVPQRAAEIVNAVAQAYIAKNLELKSEGAKKKLRFIDMQLDVIEKALKGSAQKLQHYKADNSAVNLSGKVQLVAQKLSDLESRLYQLNMQLDMAESMMNHLQKSGTDALAAMDYSPLESPTLNRLMEQIGQVRAEYASMLVNYTPRHPGVIKKERELGYLKKSLKEALSAHIEALKQQKERLLQEIDTQKRQLEEVPEHEQQLEQLTRGFSVNEKIYAFLLEKRTETAILASSTISGTRIIENADVPGAPVKPKRKMIVLVGFILGLILGTLQAMLRHFFDNRINTQEEIEQLSDVSIYGVLPLANGRKNAMAYYKEAIRSLWINLAFVKSTRHAKVIALTSTISGEGKTFTAFHLGQTIAKSSHHKVIVLDMDLRKPTLHEKFGMKNDAVGISTVLSGRYTVKEAVKTTDYENLDVIFSGLKAPNPTRLIMSDAFDAMIETLSETYAYILIDTPPVGIVSDARKIMYSADLTLFILKAGVSKKVFLREINRYSEDENINVGIVLNGVSQTRSYYQNGYYQEKYMHDYTLQHERE